MKRNKMTRRQVYKEIDLEREYQKQMGPERTLDGDNHTVGDHITLLQAYVNKAVAEYADRPGDERALHVIRKITALGVRCLEKHGCPRRQRLKRVLG